MAQLEISDDTYHMLSELARLEGTSTWVVLGKAVEEHQKKRFFESLGLAFSSLKNDANEWIEEQHERQDWEGTLADNTEPDEIWADDGRISVTT